MKEGFLNRYSIYLPNEDRLVFFSVSFSLLLHLIILFSNHLEMFTEPRPLITEWSLDTELLSEDSFSDITKLPDAKEADKVNIPSNLLPQLPKKFAIQEKPKAEEGFKDEPLENKDKGKETKEEDPESLISKPDEDASNKLAMKDALKRLAIEKLREDQQDKTKQLEAEKEDKLARLKDAIKDNNAIKSALAVGLKREQERYQALLEKVIRRHYTLPQTFQTNNLQPVVIAIKINVRGGLMSVIIAHSSNDTVFDEYSINAAKNAAPYPRPPKSLAGKLIHLTFSK